MKPRMLFVKFSRSIIATVVVFLSVICCSFFLSAPKKNLSIDIYYQNQLTKLKFEIDSLKQLSLSNISLPVLKEGYVKARMCYKELAVLSEYYNTYETKYINGPALKRVEEDNPETIIPAHGFQLIEEYIFGDWKKENYNLIVTELDFILTIIYRLENEPDRITNSKMKLFLRPCNRRS